jgi:hypothetical protein
VFVEMLVCTIVLIVLHVRAKSRCSIYATSTSPDRRFEIVVCRGTQHPFVPAMPGQGDDVPGEVRLVDLTTGDILETADLDIVGSYPGATWEDGYVDILQVARWRLPPDGH